MRPGRRLTVGSFSLKKKARETNVPLRLRSVLALAYTDARLYQCLRIRVHDGAGTLHPRRCKTNDPTKDTMYQKCMHAMKFL